MELLPNQMGQFRGGDDYISNENGIDQPIRVADGSFSTNDKIGDEVDNPHAVVTERLDNTKTDNFRANFYANYDIIEGPAFKTTFGLSNENRTRGIFCRQH
jgi:hypothetical protein